MFKSDTIGKLALALSKAQSSMSHASKDAKNPHFKSTFSSLASVIDAVRPHLAANELAYYHDVRCEDSVVTVGCTIAHSSGEWVRSEFSARAKDAQPQSIGSTVSYGKRYSLQALAGVASADEDDDAERATTRKPAYQEPVDSARADALALYGQLLAVDKGLANEIAGKAKQTGDYKTACKLFADALGSKAQGVDNAAT
jgi:hypothetical protein